MRRLLPTPMDDVGLVDAYSLPTGRRFVRCNMISTLDGAVTLNGRSGAIGGPPDRQVFHTLRSLADVIVVGAGTARAEGYGPARIDDEARAQRRDRGQAPVPPIAVVTRSCDLDWTSPLFAEAEARPIVLTVADADPGARRRAEEVADVMIAGEGGVEPGLALARLEEAGLRNVLLEGGPGLNADVAHAGLLDELCLTVAPRLAAGDGPRVLAGPELSPTLDGTIVHLLEEDGFLFFRLAVVNPGR